MTTTTAKVRRPRRIATGPTTIGAVILAVLVLIALLAPWLTSSRSLVRFPAR